MAEKVSGTVATSTGSGDLAHRSLKRKVGRERIEHSTQGFSVPIRYGEVREYLAFSSFTVRSDPTKPDRSDAGKGRARDGRVTRC